ncbi:MAG: cob(I)yrinic acid a,c-diamide adenosyltransferase [Nitrospirae bacterium]|nr:cob(I)yrinic acid a,c-diamide adenosyltransferase [Nitrospirota bacterium]
MSKGLIHVYTGEGKGKTTAAFGLAKRAAGHGRKALILQFLKSMAKDSGEAVSSKKAGIEVIRFKNQNTPLFNPRANLSKLKEAIKKSIAFSKKKKKSGSYDVIIMDEFNIVLSDRLATMNDVKKIMNAKPESLELVFTGRGAPEKLIKIADYVTEMRMIKHPFNKGVKARKGIEF